MKQILIIALYFGFFTFTANAQSSQRISKSWLKNSFEEKTDPVCETTFEVHIDCKLPTNYVARQYLWWVRPIRTECTDTNYTIKVRFLKVPANRDPLKDIKSVCRYLNVRELTFDEFARLGTADTYMNTDWWRNIVIGTATVKGDSLLVYRMSLFSESENNRDISFGNTFTYEPKFAFPRYSVYIPVVELSGSLLPESLETRYMTPSTAISNDELSFRKSKIENDFSEMDILIANCKDTLVQKVYTYARRRSVFCMTTDTTNRVPVPIYASDDLFNDEDIYPLRVLPIYSEDSLSAEARYLDGHGWGGYYLNSENHISLANFNRSQKWRVNVTLHEMCHYYDLTALTYKDSSATIMEYHAYLFALRANIACFSNGEESYDDIFNDSILNYIVSSPYFELDTTYFYDFHSSLYDSIESEMWVERVTDRIFLSLSDSIVDTHTHQLNWEENQRHLGNNYADFLEYSNMMKRIKEVSEQDDGNFHRCLSFIFIGYIYRDNVVERNRLLQKCIGNH